jgi:hypothetical protein
MSYASTSVDRRADYYARCAAVIAADPLSFYCRAEKGRRWLEGRFTLPMNQPTQVFVDNYLGDLMRRQWVRPSAFNAAIR